MTRPMVHAGLLALLASAGCALLDARQDLCERPSHCDSDMACTKEGCQPIREFGLAASCDVDSECRVNLIADANGIFGIDCPTDKVCECKVGACVYQDPDGAACTSSGDCGNGFCSDGNICFWPFSCGSHLDCPTDSLCTAEGCAWVGGEACTGTGSCGLNKSCINLQCFLRTTTPCHTSSDCAGDYCLLPEAHCYEPTTVDPA